MPIDCNVDLNVVPTQLAYNLGLPSVCQWNAILMAFRWWADGGPFLVVTGITGILKVGNNSQNIINPNNEAFNDEDDNVVMFGLKSATKSMKLSIWLEINKLRLIGSRDRRIKMIYKHNLIAKFALVVFCFMRLKN